MVLNLRILARLFAVTAGLILIAGTGVMPVYASELTLAPEVLSRTDTTLYKEIFQVQEVGQWKRADKLIKQLSDELLLGHVMAQRYLHPTKYRSRYKELKDWLGRYADHPQAGRLYKLALRRKPKNWRMPKAPARIKAKSETKPATRKGKRLPSKRLSRAGRSKARHLQRHVRQVLRRGHTLAAKRALQTANAKQYLSDAQYDQLSARLGFAYFTDGRDNWALQWAGKAAERSGEVIPEAHWTAGLASWRAGKKDIAAYHFEEAARHSTHADWLHAAAAFWAARAHLVNRRPDEVNAWLALGRIL